MKDRRLLLYIALVVMLALMPVGTMHILWPHFIWQNEPVHSFIETVGAVAAIFMAIVLLQRQPNEGGRRLFWVAMGLLGAGILDGFHAASQLGQGFVLLHSTAVLVGGFGFALVWLPESERYVFVRKWILWAVIIGSTLFGIWTLLFGGMLPVMVQDGEFTITARVMNLLSGVFFLAAGGRFLLDFQRSMKSEPYLFSCMALLFGLASLMFTYSALWDDGWWFWHAVRLSAYLLVMGFVINRYLQTVLSLRTEITEHAKTEEKLKHLYGILLTIRRINQIIVEVDNESELLVRACDTLVDGRNYKMAWVGFTADGSYDVLPVAQAGFEEGYLSSIKVTWDDSEYGRGTTGTAIRTRRPSVMRDIVNDERYQPWREEALKRGYVSSAALPLIAKDKVIGALKVYSEKPDVFDDNEIDMLVELAGDISLGIERIRQRAELRQSEERYRTTLDSMMEGCQIIDFNWRYVYLNDAAIKHGRSTREALLGHTMMEIYPGIENTEMFANLRRCMEKRIPQRMENLFTYPDGSQGWFELSIEPVTEGIFILSLDITERKRAEEALIQSEEQLKQLKEHLQLQIDRMPLALILWDMEFRAQSWNPAAETMFGYTAEEALGKHPYDIIVPKEDQLHVDNIWRRLLKGDTTAHSVNENTTKDGQTIICDWTNTPLRKGDGKIIGVLSMVRDITERRRAEAKIEQAAREWQTTFDSISDWVSIHDKDFKVIRVNKAFADALKMKPEEIIGRHCYELIHGEREANQYCAHKEVLENGKPSRREFYNPHLGIYMEVLCSPIFDDGGKITTTVHIGRDITERKKMDEQLILTDRLASIGELASGIAHELNNPLTGVIGFSDLLLEKDVPDDVREDLEVINREAKRTAQVVRGLLTFARKHPSEKQPVNINSIIENVLGLRAYEQKISNIEVKTRFAVDVPEITANASELQQVFLNIVINAEHFMAEAHGRGALTITTERIRNMVRASFTDDGPGIAEENLPHVFDPFFTTKEVGKGTGLGLSISHGIVTAHDGRIYVESEPGKGATFIIELPVSK